MFWWVFDLFFCIKGATASGDQKWTWPMLKLLYNRESSLVLSVPRGVGWRGGEGDSRGRRCESESCSIMSNSLWPHGLYGPWNSPGQNTEVGVAFPFSRGSSQPRDQIWVSCIAGGFFTIWATREALCFSAKTMSQHTVISFHRSNRELLNGNSKQLRSCFHWGLLIFFFSLLTGTCQEKVSK